MAQGTYGVMTHYLPQPSGAGQAEQTADLNRLADLFDIDHFVRQFQETGADWLIFTLGQQSGYLCSANPVFDATTPGHTPRRDVALEVARSTARTWQADDPLLSVGSRSMCIAGPQGRRIPGSLL